MKAQLVLITLLLQACALPSFESTGEAKDHAQSGASNSAGNATNIRFIDGTSASMPEVETLQVMSHKNIFMQQEDYSCGAASLATLMHYYFNEDTDESRMLATIRESFSSEEYKRIENMGLSFLELETISKAMGYQSASVRLPVEALAELTGPVIVYLQRPDYQHFAVLKGVAGDRIFIADPSRGNIRVSRAHFLKEWDGRTFVLGKANFQQPRQHALSVDARSNYSQEQLAIESKLFKHPPVKLLNKPMPRRLQ